MRPSLLDHVLQSFKEFSKLQLPLRAGAASTAPAPAPRPAKTPEHVPAPAPASAPELSPLHQILAVGHDKGGEAGHPGHRAEPDPLDQYSRGKTAGSEDDLVVRYN